MHCSIGDALFVDQTFERIEPVPVIAFARIGIASGLRALDFLGQRVGPFGPGEQAALMQRQRHGEGLRLPRLAKHRPVLVPRHPRYRVHAGSR